MAVKLDIRTCEAVEVTWEGVGGRVTFVGSSGKKNPSALDFVETAVGVCIGRGITAHLLRRDNRACFSDNVKGFGDIAIDIVENMQKEGEDDVDWVVDIICTTKSKEHADILTKVCAECTILKMLQADVALNFVNNPYPDEEPVNDGSSKV
jgi:hypothetical protein